MERVVMRASSVSASHVASGSSYRETTMRMMSSSSMASMRRLQTRRVVVRIHASSDAHETLADDGTSRAPIDAWLASYDAPGAREPPACVFAVYDEAGACVYVDYARNAATALRATRARAGAERASTARVLAFRNAAMATRETLAREARRWKEALGEGETPALNAEWDAEDDAEALGGTDVRVMTTTTGGDDGNDDADVTAETPVMVSPFAKEAMEESNDASDATATATLELTAENVDKALDEVRPYLVADGGNVELVSIEDGIVVVRLNGACGTCASSSATMKGGIEKLLRQKFGDAVEEVVNVSGELEEMSVETIEGHLEKLRKSITSYGGEVSVESLERGVCVLRFKGPQALAFSIAQAIKTKFPLVRECKIRQVK
jgi:Fe-S cluster biogenesis protein NfuA